jgi:uncharacterized membrane protein YccC
VLVPHQTPLAMAGVLALGVAPLAYAAAVNPAFRVAPFTAVIVLLISSQLGETPVQSALDRLLEVAIGGGVAVAVSLLVFPERARRLGLEEASRVLDALSRALPELLAGFTRRPEGFDNQHLQDEIGRAVAAFQTRAVEIDRERLVNFVAEPDPAALAQILLRIRHDFVMLGRASGEPLPGGLAQRLAPALERIGESAGAFLKLTAAALSSRRSPPLFDPVEASFAAYGSEFAALREAGLTRPLASSELERLFALGFTLQQLQQDLPDLARCVQDWARPASR